MWLHFYNTTKMCYRLRTDVVTVVVHSVIAES